MNESFFNNSPATTFMRQAMENHNPELYCKPHHSWTPFCRLQHFLLNVLTVWNAGFF